MCERVKFSTSNNHFSHAEDKIRCFQRPTTCSVQRHVSEWISFQASRGEREGASESKIQGHFLSSFPFSFFFSNHTSAVAIGSAPSVSLFQSLLLSFFLTRALSLSLFFLSFRSCPPAFSRSLTFALFSFERICSRTFSATTRRRFFSICCQSKPKKLRPKPFRQKNVDSSVPCSAKSRFRV